MKNFCLAAAMLAACTLQGAVITINYDDNASVTNGAVGNTITRTSGVFSVVASGWSVGSNGTFSAARLNDYGTPGLGVCNTNEQTTTSSCSSSGDPSEHQVSNLNGDDFVMFQIGSGGFPVAVKTFIVTIHYLASDWDVTYYLGNAAAGLNLASGYDTDNNPIGAGFSTTVGSVNNTNDLSIDVSNTTAYNTLIFGTRLGGSNDGFKIKSLSFETVGGGTGTNETIPEPATVAMLGAGLIGLGYMRRKKA